MFNNKLVLDGGEAHEVQRGLSVVHLQRRLAHLNGLGIYLTEMSLEIGAIEHILDLR